jgi:hypothetical protein
MLSIRDISYWQSRRLLDGLAMRLPHSEWSVGMKDLNLHQAV